MSATITRLRRTPAAPPHLGNVPEERQGPPRLLGGGVAESLIIFAVFAIAYVLLGYQVVINQHVVVFDSLDKLLRAYMVWFNDPPKLASIGFVFPPITTMAFLPFVVIKPLATSGFALPLTSGLFMALTMVGLNRTFDVTGLGAPLRYALLLVFGLNPMIAFYATNGQPAAVYMSFLAFALYCFVAWFEGREPRYLIGAGIAFSVAMLTRYEFMIWAVAVALLIAGALAARHASRDEVEGSVIAYLAPIVYGFTLWVFFNLLIIGDPFGWVDVGTVVSVNNPSGLGGTDVSFVGVVSHVAEINARLFPLTFVVLPVSLIVGFAQRNYPAIAFAVLILINMVLTGVSAYVAGTESVIELSDAIPAMVVALVGAAWLFYSLEDAGIAVWAITLALGIAALPLAWDAMGTYPFQNLEDSFTKAIATGQSQEGRASRGGYRVGIDSEQAMADYITKNIPQKRGIILSDNSQTFAPILLTGRPGMFFDRVDKGDVKWLRALNRPGPAKVQYFLVSSAQPDLVRQRYPFLRGTGGGALEGFRRQFTNSRYTLARVPANLGESAGTARQRAQQQRQQQRSQQGAQQQRQGTTSTPLVSPGIAPGSSGSGGTLPPSAR